METDILRGELERLFKLDELIDLTHRALGVRAEDVGGQTSLATFSQALVTHARENDLLDALVDAVAAARTEVDPRIQSATVHGVPSSDEVPAGQSLGAYTIVRKLGEGPLAHTYVAKAEGKDWVLRVVRSDVARDRPRLFRYLAAHRLASGVDHGGIPRGGFAKVEDGRAILGYEHAEAQSLAARIGRTGPMHLNEARPTLKAILEALAALHDARLVHGNLKLENVLVVRTIDGSPRVLLSDAGTDRLRRRMRALGDVLGMVVTPKIAAPELHRGKGADAKSDVYAFGVLLYELLSGRPPFVAGTPVEVATLHLAKEPEPPSAVAPRGWVTKELDAFVLQLLAKEPTARPKDARAALEALDAIGRTQAARTGSTIGDDELTARIDALVATPDDGDAALALESAVEEGADAAKVADAFMMAAATLDGGSDDVKATKKSLFFRAGRLFDQHAKDKESAEKAYLALLEIDPTDDIAEIALEEVRRSLGKYEEIVEMLLARSERAESRAERSRALADIGRLYAQELDDRAQALVAYTQALCEDAASDDHAAEVEKLAGTSTESWGEVTSTIAETLTTDIAVEARNALALRLGRWYAGKLGRQDLALPCFQGVVATDPANDAALEGMADIYRTAQQWNELGAVLLRRADIAQTPAAAREFKAQAADLLDGKMNEPLRAKDLYEQILADDPTHGHAIDALARIYERTGDPGALVKVLEKRAEAEKGGARAASLTKIAELYENQLDDLPEAMRRYEAALTADERHLDALKGLDRILVRTGRYKELLANLERQLAIAATPRQKINLHERMAGICDEEFLDHESAAKGFEKILEIDPSHENALTALVRHYRALDRWEDVAALYDRHLKVTTDDARRVELLLAKGRVLAEQVGSPERAMSAYQSVTEIVPDHAGALESLARLREQTGDAAAALSAIESLAAKASAPEQKAEQWIRAARLLESKGDRDGAIERYKAALDADAKNVTAAAALRAAYTQRGDASSAVELIAREIDQAQGNLSKARLYGEMARLLRDRVKDQARAVEAAKKALELDPTAMDALLILGDDAFADGRFVEASKHYESLANRTDALPKADATRVLAQYMDGLAKTGSTEKALQSVDKLLELAPDDADALLRASRIVFDHGEPKRARELARELLDKHGAQLLAGERGAALYRVGESSRKLGELDEAIQGLKDAADTDPSSTAPIDALARVYADKGDWEEVVRIKNRRVDVTTGDERSELLLEIGDILSTKLGDRTRAAKSFVAALEDKPDDRKLLTKLMQLYSEEKDWAKLVEVIVKLAEFVDDKKQKAKYLHTAAGLVHKQLLDLEQAAGLFDQVLLLDPTTKAIADAIELRREKGDFDDVEALLKRQLDRAKSDDDKERQAATFDALGELYHRNLGRTDDAVDAFEAAQALDPDDKERNERLADMYASDPSKYLDKAVLAQSAVMARNPLKPEPYKLLRRLYTEAKRADSAWCLCQALVCLNMAEPDEERFYKRMRAESPAAAQTRVTEEDWAMRLRHPDADPLLTALFAMIESAVIAARTQPLEHLGYDPRYAIDLSLHPYAMSQTLYYATGVLGMTPPVTFQNPNDPGGLAFLHAQTPGIVLGHAALSADVPPQAAAFLAARHLAYYRHGFYIRHLVPTGTGLKAWLFAAIKLISPQFPLSPDIEGQVTDNMEALKAAFSGPSRDHLASIVTKLLGGGGSLDLKKWVHGVDLSADRAGFLLAHDLETALELVKASGEDGAALPMKERVKELALFAVSEDYFDLRRSLGVAIDS